MYVLKDCFVACAYFEHGNCRPLVQIRLMSSNINTISSFTNGGFMKHFLDLFWNVSDDALKFNCELSLFLDSFINEKFLLMTPLSTKNYLFTWPASEILKVIEQGKRNVWIRALYCFSKSSLYNMKSIKWEARSNECHFICYLWNWHDNIRFLWQLRDIVIQDIINFYALYLLTEELNWFAKFLLLSIDMDTCQNNLSEGVKKNCILDGVS